MLTRLGVPVTVRVDNKKAAIIAGTGAWGTPHPTTAATPSRCAFTSCLCTAQPRGQGQGRAPDPRRSARLQSLPQHWNDLGELQTTTDRSVENLMARRTCPVAGTPVRDAWHHERAALSALSEPLPEPFDIAVCRCVGVDCTVVFEDRRYSVSFAWLDRRVEIHGCAHSVQILAGGSVVAAHPRATRERIVIDPAHYEGPSRPTVTAPVALGRWGAWVRAWPRSRP